MYAYFEIILTVAGSNVVALVQFIQYEGHEFNVIPNLTQWTSDVNYLIANLANPPEFYRPITLNVSAITQHYYHDHPTDNCGLICSFVVSNFGTVEGDNLNIDELLHHPIFAELLHGYRVEVFYPIAYTLETRGADSIIDYTPHSKRLSMWNKF